MLRTGAAWRDLPLDYGHWKSVYHRYNNGSKKGYITAILAELKKEGDHEWHLLDGSIIKVHQDAMRSCYGKAAECWPPSSSIISRFSRQTKSAMYAPIGTCLLNLNPSRLARRGYQRCSQLRLYRTKYY